MPILDFDDVPNQELWLEGRQLSGGPFSDNDPVSTWNDVSGNARDAIAGTAPVYASSSINGEPGLKFVAGSVLNLPNFLTGFTEGEIFLVAKSSFDPPKIGGLEGSLIQGFGSAADLNHFPYTDGNAYLKFGSTVRKTVGPPQSILTRPYLLNIWSANGDWGVRVNGREIFSTASNTVGWGTVPVIGAAGGYSFHGQIVAIVLYSRKLIATERTDVEDLVTSRYAIPMDIPQTVQAGNASSGATWSSGVVPTGEHVLIRHALAVDANLSVLGMQIDAPVTVEAGITLTFAGDAYSRQTLTLEGGAILRCNTGSGNNLRYIQGTTHTQTDCKVATSGTTSGSRATIERTGTGTLWFDLPRESAGGGPPTKTSYWDVEYVDFNDIVAPAGVVGIAHNVDAGAIFRHCSFDGCGECPSMEQPASADVDLTGSKWTNVVSPNACTLNVNAAAVDPENLAACTTRIDECYFEKKCNMIRHSGMMIRNSVFKEDSLGSTLGGVGSYVIGNFHRQTDSGTNVALDEDVADCYFLCDDLAGNPHFFATKEGKRYSGVLFDFPHPFALDTGDCFLGECRNVTLERNITLFSISDGDPAGYLANYGLSSTPVGNMKLHHNTVGKWGVLLGELSAPVQIYSEIKGNLCYSSQANLATLLFDFSPTSGDADVAAGLGCTHNGIYNAADHTDTLNGSAVYEGYVHEFPSGNSPGANDLVDVDPQFVDRRRCLAKWAVYKGVYGGPVDDNNWTALEVRAALDAGMALMATNPLLAATDLIPWVKAGFEPQNEAYRTAAHDGTTIGAVEMSAAPVEVENPSNLQTTVVGATITLTWEKKQARTPTTAISNNDGDQRVDWYAEHDVIGSIDYLVHGIKGEDDSSETHGQNGGGMPSAWLECTGFGFNIPSNPTGIEVRIVRACTTVFGALPQARDDQLRLIKAGVTQAHDKADVLTAWSVDVFESVVYGGPTDLWGGGWTAADINDPGFGVSLSIDAFESTASCHAHVDYIEIRVYFADGSQTEVWRRLAP